MSTPPTPPPPGHGPPPGYGPPPAVPPSYGPPQGYGQPPAPPAGYGPPVPAYPPGWGPPVKIKWYRSNWMLFSLVAVAIGVGFLVDRLITHDENSPSHAKVGDCLTVLDGPDPTQL